jgi:hypothetical protein
MSAVRCRNIPILGVIRHALMSFVRSNSWSVPMTGSIDCNQKSGTKLFQPVPDLSLPSRVLIPKQRPWHQLTPHLDHNIINQHATVHKWLRCSLFNRIISNAQNICDAANPWAQIFKTKGAQSSIFLSEVFLLHSHGSPSRLPL